MSRGSFHPTFVSWEAFGSQDGLPHFPDRRVLAEGDSWFTISGIPAYNLLFALRFPKPTCIVNCAFPGDRIKHMSQISENRQLQQALSRWGGVRWDLILLSGGGNDLIDRADDIILDADKRDPARIQGQADYCDEDKLKKLIQDIQSGYRRIAALRDAPGSPNRGVPILTHTYDYATPRNAPANFIFGSLGPWLYKALNKNAVPQSDWVGVADYLIDRLAEGILALSKGGNRLQQFYVVNTRGTLIRAELGNTGPSTDWQNEIHPNGMGYKKLAKRMAKKLNALLAR